MSHMTDLIDRAIVENAARHVVFRRIDNVYRITYGEHDYRVVHCIWAANSWHHRGESWNVYASNNDRECDPTKPTFKRVVAAVKAVLAEGA